MKLFIGWRGGWILRRLLRGQEQQNRLLERIAASLEQIAAAQRVLAQATLGENAGGGFRTGLPDGREDSGLVRSSDAELADLLWVEGEMTRSLGRAPTSEEVVARYEELKAGGSL